MEDDTQVPASSNMADLVSTANIVLEGYDPMLAAGFTMVPNLILNDPNLSVGAKIVYAKFLQYAWEKNYCYPGQKRLGEEIGLSEGRVSQLIKELVEAGLLTVKRRGLNQTNMYTLHMVVQGKMGRTKGVKS